MSKTVHGRIRSTLRQFLDREASDGLILIPTAVLAILIANSPAAETYFHALHIHLGRSASSIGSTTLS